MVKGIASCGVVGFVLLAACGAWCQVARQSLPDAPSALIASPMQRSEALVEEARPPLSVGATGAPGWSMRQEGLLFSSGTTSHHKDPDAIFRKYLYPSSPGRPSTNRSANDGSLMGRGVHAAERTVVTRNELGKGRINTSYLLRTLTSVAKDSASTPYWRRHFTNSAGDFGSTVGSDAGMNLWHEFGPSVEHLLKNHAPAFVSRIEARMGRG